MSRDLKMIRYKLTDLMNPNKRRHVLSVQRVVEGKPNEQVPLGELRKDDRVILQVSTGGFWSGIMHNRTEVNLVMQRG